MTAAKMASTTRIPLTRTSLSSEPNSRMAKFFSHGGVKSICSSPTATTGDPLAPVSPATNCPTPSAVPAASSPAMAPSPARLPSLRLILMLFIRCGHGAGLAGQATTGQHSKPWPLLLRISVMTAIERPAPEPAGEGPGDTSDLAARIRLVARGDAGAFDAVYDLLAASVFGIVRRVIRDPAQSEEVTQDVLLEVWRNASKFDAERGSAIAWVMTLAHRRAVDRVRSVQKESERERRTAAADIPYDEVAEAVESSLERERVRRCLGSLTELQRESVTLAYYGGYTYGQVASLLGVPAGTIKTRMRDALIRLRDCLGVTA